MNPVRIVESTSSNPELGGDIEVRAEDEALFLRWRGEKDWKRVEWYEALVWSGGWGKIIEGEIQTLKEQGYTDGLTLGRDVARQEGIEQGRKEFMNRVVEMKRTLGAARLIPEARKD